MNVFRNPLFLSKILKSYLIDINRLKRIDEDTLRRYQDKRLKKMVTFAYTVPLYHDLYKKAEVHPRDIKGIQDIHKLPMVTKDDIKRYYPEGIVSSKTRRGKLVEVSTSGTTGKSLSLYVDLFDIMMGFFGYIRELREYGINWRKSRMTIIGDFAPHTVESGYITRGLRPRLNIDVRLKNMQWLNTNDPPEKLIEEINRFQPEFIGGYMGMLGHLALLKKKGLGKNVSPRIIASTGSMIDTSLKKFIESTFHAQVFESYGSTESGPIAFQCRQGSYHVMSDLVYLEVVKNNEPVDSREAGELIVTKLYGGGTPIIRYTAINDIVAPLYESCSCGMSGLLLDRIYGRNDLALFLPGGRVLLPSSFSEIYSRILYGLKTMKVKETKIIQHSLNSIEIQVVIDDSASDDKVSLDTIFSALKTGFQEKVGPDVDILVKEVNRVDKQRPRIVSKVDRSKFTIREYV